MWRCTAYKEKLMDIDIHFDKQEKCMTSENNGRFFKKVLSESGGPCQEYCLYGNDNSRFCQRARKHEKQFLALQRIKATNSFCCM